MPESLTAAVTVEHDFAVDAATAWVALSDPVTVGDALPGDAALAPADGRTLPAGSLSRLLATDPSTRDARTVAAGERYEATLGARVRGVEVALDASLAVTERDYPRLAVAGDARRAKASGERDRDGEVRDGERPADEAAVSLAAALTVEDVDGAGCRATWTARAAVPGPLASYGRRPVESAAARGANRFFEALDAHLAAVAGPESERAVKDPDWRA